MTRWRIRRVVIGGKEWFYPEIRFLLFFWTTLEKPPDVEVRFETHGEAIMWIQNLQAELKNGENVTYTYPFD
jgi:hypothetical protein